MARRRDIGKRARRMAHTAGGNIAPKATTPSSESDRGYARRTAAIDIQRRMKKSAIRKRVIIIVVVAVAAVLIAVLAARSAYRGAIDSRLHANLDSTVSDELTATESDDTPYYLLLLGLDGDVDAGNYRADCIVLARIDPANRKMTLVSIPRDIYVDLSKYGNKKIGTSYAYGGAPLAISAVSAFADVPIAHYIEINFSGFVDAIDALGGISVDVPSRIDDADAGSVIVEKGQQTLDGAQALVLCRSRRIFADGDYSRMSHERLVLRALIDKLSSATALQRISYLDSLSRCVTTDMSLADLEKLGKQLSGIDVEADIYEGVVPSESYATNGVLSVVVDDDAWSTMMERVNAGQTPLASDPANGDAAQTALDDVTASSYTVDIRNGIGITGLASEAEQRLADAGFNIGEIGNTDSFVYTETLVIYSDTSKEAVAEAVQSALGVGRVVESQSYTFTGDILVVVGGDWTP